MKTRYLPLLIGLTILLIWVIAPISTQAFTTSARSIHATHNVSIQGFAFNPTPLTIQVGDTVTWTNLDSAPHTSTSATGVWNSGTLTKNQSFSFTFTQAGTYAYLCNIHTSMTGSIIVQEPTPTNTPTNTQTDTPTPTATDTPTATPTDTPLPTDTATPTPTITETPPDSTATFTPLPIETDTPTPTITDTPPESTATFTPLPTETELLSPTSTDVPGGTVVTPPPTETKTPEPTPTEGEELIYLPVVLR
jgi:plastocyanin